MSTDDRKILPIARHNGRAFAVRWVIKPEAGTQWVEGYDVSGHVPDNAVEVAVRRVDHGKGMHARRVRNPGGARHAAYRRPGGARCGGAGGRDHRSYRTRQREARMVMTDRKLATALDRVKAAIDAETGVARMTHDEFVEFLRALKVEVDGRLAAAETREGRT